MAIVTAHLQSKPGLRGARAITGTRPSRRGVIVALAVSSSLLSAGLPFGLLCAPLLAVAAPAPAEPPGALLSKIDVQAVQATVQRQFDAFARDDAAAAFALASSGIRTQFGTADKFMSVVRKQYQPVYRHRVALFTDTERVSGAVLQTVRLTDADDRVWVAVYRLEREIDGHWHIVGCQLLETKSVST